MMDEGWPRCRLSHRLGSDRPRLLPQSADFAIHSKEVEQKVPKRGRDTDDERKDTDKSKKRKRNKHMRGRLD